MRPSTSRGVAAALAALLAAVLLPAAAVAQGPPATVYGVEATPGQLGQVPGVGPVLTPSENTLVEFRSDAPGTTRESEITGLEDSEVVVGLDARPATRELYALTDAGRVYTVDPGSGEATAVGEPIEPALDGAAFGVDFNPAADLIRVVSDTGQNLRLEPESGIVRSEDGRLAFAQGDRNAAESATVVAAGYTGNVDQTGLPESQRATQLFVLDAGLDVVALQDPPNSGTLNTVADLEVDLDETASLDVDEAGSALLSFVEGSATRFGTLDLATGEFDEVGPVGGGAQLTAITALGAAQENEPPEQTGEQVFVATELNRLIEFNSDSPGSMTAQSLIVGLAPGQRVAGLDFRPASNELFAIDTAGAVYTIVGESEISQASPTGISVDLGDAGGVGFDFNPIPDRIRVVTDTGESFRLVPETATPGVSEEVTEDTGLAFASGDELAGESVTVTAAGYSENFSGTPTTSLFVLDTENDVLATVDPPNSGALNTVGELGVDVAGAIGFDVSQTGEAFALLDTGGEPAFGTVSLADGRFTETGPLGHAPEGVTAMAVQTNVGRIFGAERVETAARLSRITFETADRVFVATSEDFADALAGGPPAAIDGSPLLLTGRDGLAPLTEAEARRLDPDEIVLLGGTDRIPQGVEDSLAQIAPVRRIGGANRFDTAALIATSEFESATVAYVATGGNFPDALTGGPAAARDEAPVLLVGADVPQPTADALRSLDPERIVILGGDQAISPSVEAALTEFGEVERRQGATRFETAADVARKSFVGAEGVTRAYVATAEFFPDALAAVAATGGASPILLVARDDVPEVTELVLNELGVDDVVLVGGPGVIDDQTARALERFTLN